MRALSLCLLSIGLSGCTLSDLGSGKTAGTAPPAVIVDQNALSAGSQRASTPQNPPVRQGGPYRVKAGDRLSVFVFDNPDLVQTVVVGPDGRFSFPLVGAVQAAGRSLNAIDATLTQRLAKNILLPEVSVTLEELSSRRIYVTGEVIAPGVFDVTEQISVVQAISMAGGFTAFADKSRITVYNPSRRTQARRVFNYTAFLANPTAYDFALRPGDTVIVQ